jgi:hypothetical protein
MYVSGSVAEPKLFDSAPAPTVKKFQLQLLLLSVSRILLNEKLTIFLPKYLFFCIPIYSTVPKKIILTQIFCPFFPPSKLNQYRIFCVIAEGFFISLLPLVFLNR